jgi:hypothetical protein
MYRSINKELLVLQTMQQIAAGEHLLSRITEVDYLKIFHKVALDVELRSLHLRQQGLEGIEESNRCSHLAGMIATKTLMQCR